MHCQIHFYGISHSFQLFAVDLWIALIEFALIEYGLYIILDQDHNSLSTFKKEH